MKKNSFFRIAAMWVLSVALMLVPVQAQAWSGDFLEAVKSFVQEMHLEGASDEALLEGALKGMLSSLDPYSSFMNSEETAAYQTSLTGQFSGIGATLEVAEDGTGVRVVSVFEDSPAEKAGIREGDIFTKVDGASLSGKTATEAAILIRGEAGTSVTLAVRRGTTTLQISVVRGAIVIHPVSFRIEGKIGYVRMTQFTSGMSEELRVALDAFKKSGVRKVMLDLRDNPGGLVSEAVAAGRLLLPPGPIVSLDYRSERMGDSSYASSNPDPGWMIAVLVNEDTASASEILAGAIQDAGNGFLIGKKTFGKGVVQSMFMLLTPQAQAAYAGTYQDAFVTDVEWASYYGVAVKPAEVLGLIKVTTGRYLTRNGRALDKEGLTPDVVVENRAVVHEVDLVGVQPLALSVTLSVGAREAVVRQAENILRMVDLFAGQPDPTFDMETVTALKGWQKSQGLAVTGQLDAGTVKSLNTKLDALRLEHDPQYAMARKALGLFSDSVSAR